MCKPTIISSEGVLIIGCESCQHAAVLHTESDGCANHDDKGEMCGCRRTAARLYSDAAYYYMARCKHLEKEAV